MQSDVIIKKSEKGYRLLFKNFIHFTVPERRTVLSRNLRKTIELIHKLEQHTIALHAKLVSFDVINVFPKSSPAERLPLIKIFFCKN